MDSKTAERAKFPVTMHGASSHGFRKAKVIIISYIRVKEAVAQPAERLGD
jgi:hypothetical protein